MEGYKISILEKFFGGVGLPLWMGTRGVDDCVDDFAYNAILIFLKIARADDVVGGVYFVSMVSAPPSDDRMTYTKSSKETEEASNFLYIS